MFDNIGKKLKTFAQWYTVMGLILMVTFTAFMLISLRLEVLIYGAIGCVSVWASGAMMYGLGQSVENTDAIRKKLAPETLEPEVSVTYVPKAQREPWTCVSCGTENLGHIPYCNGCGVSREWSNAQKEKEE